MHCPLHCPLHLSLVSILITSRSRSTYPAVEQHRIFCSKKAVHDKHISITSDHLSLAKASRGWNAQNGGILPQVHSSRMRYSCPKAPIELFCFSDSAKTDQFQANDSKRDPGLFERLGLRLLAANAAAFALILASIVFLFYLWFADHANSTWRHIMVGAWIGQAVTLCSIAIRLAIGTQAGTAVAFLASISLESSGNSGILVDQTPALSLARCVNTGPMASLCLFWRNIYQKRDRAVVALMTVLAITSFVGHFTSTLLLWDIESESVQGFPNSSRIYFGGLMEDYLQKDIGKFQDNSNYWASAAADYPIFAEWSSNPNLLPDYIRDTGPTIRAFLPIRSNEERSAITKYVGPASLFDARVLCIRPNITNFNIREVIHDETPYLTGKLEPWTKDNIDDALVSHHSGHIFNCSLAELKWVSSRSMYKVCGLLPDAGGLMSSLDPTHNSTINHTYASVAYQSPRWWANGNGKSWPIELGHTILFMSAVLPTHESSEFITDGFNSKVVGSPITEKRGAWLDFVSTGRIPGMRLSVTVCYDAL